MYQVFCDSKILYDPRTEDRVLINPKLTLESNKSGTFTFSKPITNTVEVNKLKSVIEVYKDGVLLFSGRALNDEKDFYCTGKIGCEGELAYFNDSIVRPYNFENKSVKYILDYLIKNHNSQVKERKKCFQIGKVNVVDNNGAEDSVYRSSTDYTKTWKVIEEKLLDKLGGYLQVRREKGVKYLDYLKEYTHINSQVIEFRSNLLDITQFTNAADVVTVLIPLGKKDYNENYTTIESVNDGKDYIYDKTAVSLYGWIWGIQQWEDITKPINLLNRAESYIKDCVNLALTLELTAIDLSILDINIENIKVGDWVRVISTPHGLDKYFLVTKMTLDLNNPGNNKITLGDTIKGLTDKQIKAKKDSNSKIEDANLNINKNKKNIKKVDGRVTTVNNRVTAVDNHVNDVDKEVVEVKTKTKNELTRQQKFMIMEV